MSPSSASSLRRKKARRINKREEMNIVKAPEIKHYLHWLGRVEYRNIDCSFTYDEASYATIDRIFNLLHRLEPDPKNNGWELWLHAERGTIQDFGSFEEMLEDGQVDSFEEFEAWWKSEFPEEVEWFHFSACEDQEIGYQAVFLGHRHVLEVDGQRERFFPHDISKFTSWLEEAVRNAVQAVKDGTYQTRVEQGLPIRHRTGTVLRRDLWEVFPEWKEKFFREISKTEVEEFLNFVVGYPLETDRRLPSMTANNFYHACALGYRAMGYDGTEKPEKEQYALHADGRDEGLSELDGDSPEAFARWLKERSLIGHPWEVCRGGNRTHIDCIVCKDAHGYYLTVAGLAESRTIEAIHFFLALYRAGIPVCIRNAEELKARLTGMESIGIVPEGVFPAYCHSWFPGEGIVDFMNLPWERQEELAKYCRWQPIPVPRLKKEGERP